MRFERLPGGWHGLVVVRAGTFFNATRLADQHIAHHLAALGVPILYVDPPVSMMSPRNDPRLAAVLREPPLRLLGPRLARLTPRVLPGKSRNGVVHVTDALIRRQLRAAKKALDGHTRAVLTVATRPGFGDFDERVRVFWARDDYAAGAALMNLPVGRVERDELRMARSADLVIAVSSALEHRWTQRGRPTVFIPNGCDARGLADVDAAGWPADVTLPGPILGVVGTLGERLDLDLLERVADEGHSLLLVGAKQKSFPADRLLALSRRPNVCWVGPKAYAELPSYLRAIDVGLVPYQDSAFNRASFPLKTLEYLAAGRSVVTTDLPASRWLNTQLIRVAAGDAFLAAVDDAIQEARASRGQSIVKQERRAFAAQHDWSQRAKDILAQLP
jgi:teichuronic acid biosynthesis glycosyltransferase TuaH